MKKFNLNFEKEVSGVCSGCGGGMKLISMNKITEEDVRRSKEDTEIICLKCFKNEEKRNQQT